MFGAQIWLIMRFTVYTYATVTAKGILQGKSKIGHVNLFLCYPWNIGFQEKEGDMSAMFLSVEWAQIL